MSGLAERNPFVGPRPIQRGEPLHGRDKEVRGLYDRLQARRIVVLHSPSGAGKSSLVQAGLIPKLLEGGFDVWKPIRVNLDPRGLSGVPEGTNRYLLSALVSLEEELPEDHRRPPAELATLRLLEYIETRPRRKGRAKRPVVLLFDQFEEVLTIEPHAVEAKRQFFTAVGEALDTGEYWALFVIREDYLAAFSPFRDRVPTQMSNQFRLDLLGRDGAQQALVALSRAGGREFPAADQLVRDLSTVQVQQPDGSFVDEQGLHVEPVHLQVVCKRLWDSMPDDDLSIDPEDIEAYAGVSDALAGYYADAVAGIAEGDVGVERSIREWVSANLVVGGNRSQVRQEKDETAGLPNALIRKLLNAYVVRAEQRAGANWFELSHDRMVEPVEQNNAEWEKDHLHPLQVQAKLWQAQGRGRDHLLRAGALEPAERWARKNPERLTEDEQEFLRRSRGRRKTTARLIIAASVLLATAIGTAIFALTQWVEAETLEYQSRVGATRAKVKARHAETSALIATRAKMLAEHQRARARQAALTSYVRTFKDKDPTRAVQGLLKLDESTGGWLQDALDLSHQPIARAQVQGKLMAWSPDGARVLTTADLVPMLWSADGVGEPVRLPANVGVITSAEFSPDGTKIVTTSSNEVVVSRTGGTGEPFIFKGHEQLVHSARFSPDGTKIVSASMDGTVKVWAVDGTGKPQVFTPRTSSAAKFADFSPDGTRIITAWSPDRLRIWDVDHSGEPIELSGHEGVWSPDGTKLLVSRGHMGARLSEFPSLVSMFGFSINRAAAFSADGRTIYGIENQCWRHQSLDDFGSALSCHRTKVTAVDLDFTGQRAISGAADGSLQVWSLVDGLDPIILRGDEPYIHAVRFSPDGTTIGTSDGESTRLWDVPIPFGGKLAQRADYSPNGWHLVVIPSKGENQVWTPDGSKLVLSFAGSVHWGGPQGDLLVARSPSGDALRFWDVHDSSAPVLVQESLLPGAAEITDFSGNGRHVSMVSRGKAWIWDRQSTEIPIRLSTPRRIETARFSPAGRTLITTSGETVLWWDIADLTSPPLPLLHEGRVRDASFSSSGLVLTVAADDAWIWTETDGTEPIRFSTGGRRKVTSATFLPNELRVLVVTESDGIWLWSPDYSNPPYRKGAFDHLPTGLDRKKLTGRPDSPVTSAVFSSNGQRLVVTGQDGIAWVWDLGSGSTPLQLRHPSPVHSASISADGNHVVTLWGSGSDHVEDLQARLWTLDPQVLRRQLEDASSVCMSVDDHLVYLGDTMEEACHHFQQCEYRYDRPGECASSPQRQHIPLDSRFRELARAKAAQQSNQPSPPPTP